MRAAWKAGRPEVRPDVARPSLVAGLGGGLQVDVGQHAGAQAVASGEQGPALRRGDAVEAAPQPGMERNVPVGLEQERVEERLAELAVAGPRGARLVGGERADVDERRPRPDPLHVEGGGVLERQALVERRQREIELQQGGVPEHAERPFVRVRHDRQAGMLEDRRPLRPQAREGGAGHRPRADQAALAGEALEQVRAGEPLPVREGPFGQCAVDAAVVLEDARVGVAEGTRLEARRAARRHGAATVRRGRRGRPRCGGTPPSGDARTASR